MLRITQGCKQTKYSQNKTCSRFLVICSSQALLRLLAPTSNPVSRCVHACSAPAHAAARVRTAPQSAVRRLFGNQLSAAPFPAPPPASCQ